MALDALEKEKLKKQMALRLRAFLGTANSIDCISSHWYDQPHPCELSGLKDSQEFYVIKNSKNRKMQISLSALKEMIRFQVVDFPDFKKWASKAQELKADAAKRKAEEAQRQDEERKKHERRVIVRRRSPEIS